MKYLIVLYLIIPFFMLIMTFVSINEEIPEELSKDEGLEKIFHKISVYIYRNFLGNNKIFLRSPGRRHVRDNLQKLDSEADIGRKLAIYFIKKISTMLVLSFVGSLLALLSYFVAVRNYSLNTNGEIVRNDFGEGEKQAKLTAIDETGEAIGDYDLTINEMEYSKHETERLYKGLLEKLPETMLQNNEDFKHVNSTLNLPMAVDGYPFNISWESDNIDVLHSDGKVENNDIKFKETSVILTAKITYKDYKWEHIFNIIITPREFSENEAVYQEVENMLKEKEETSRRKDRFELPKEAGGNTLTWKEKIDESSLIILLISLTVSASVFALGDKDLMKQVEERKKQMILEYPNFVSRLVLYMGSGMSVRGVLTKFSVEYKKHVREGGKRSFLYEEICKSCNEIQSGVPEIQVYERLGARCGSQQYARLVTLLSQNLKKGNSEMMLLLREESDKATMERMSYARKLGEEAGTKLLVPMVMMLFIVMVVIMVPAYLSF
ncbi:immunoglobulin-like domain-containing protein [Butyrivibrio sp. AE3004]|uniref:immunoglobulin-like domain-containing protein n=1 Tax=Butyrivibrio sp. AE3004 TaxID=1506994 RepID=UPI0004949AFC|nr:immunoglobulin-like domain-containing protein [Butyrivibrio sp. AE3004]